MNRSLRLILALSFMMLTGYWSQTLGEGMPSSGPGTAPIYGEDGREEVLDHPDLRLREMARSVAALVPNRDVRVSGRTVALGGESLDEYVIEKCGAPLCEGGRFRDQPTPAFCTGFLVESDLLVTAGHCVETDRECRRTSFVFDFRIESSRGVAPLDTNNVYRCEALVRNVHRNDSDFSILRLDRDTGRRGLAWASSSDIDEGTPLAIVGHPFGLPMKIAAGGEVVESRRRRSVFETNLDAFDSNSGSPVINTRTYRVEGLLTSGDEDFERMPLGCYALRVCPNDGSECKLEDVLRMSVVGEYL